MHHRTRILNTRPLPGDGLPFPVVRLRSASFRELQFSHVQTVLVDDGDARSIGMPVRAPRGTTSWTADCRTSSTGAACRAHLVWEWTWIPPGAVALVDPHSLHTNVSILDEKNQPLQAMEIAMSLNQVVHGLAWQEAVMRAIDGAAAAPNPSRDAAPDSAFGEISGFAPFNLAQPLSLSAEAAFMGA